jgi:hypothetical protein
LHFTFLCSLGVELYKLSSTGTSQSRADFETQSKLLSAKLEASFKAMGDNLGVLREMVYSQEGLIREN